MTAVLSLPPVPVILRRAFASVHIAGFAADEGFVRFDFARELARAAISQSEADTVIHEPCGLLGDADVAMPSRRKRFRFCS